MSIELNQKFSQLVKRVEFFPFEWSANLLAVCFADSVKLYTFVESANYRREDSELLRANLAKKDGQHDSGKLNLVSSVSFQQKIEHFSWSPNTYIATLKPVINFAVSDCSQHIHLCSANLGQPSSDRSQMIIDSDGSGGGVLGSNIKSIKQKLDVDVIYSISFDHQGGEILAINADNFCLLWDTVDSKIRAKFMLQSPGINICWNRDEKTKLMVGEKSGLIRIFSLETFKPVYTIMCLDSANKSISFPLLQFDWCQLNPEFIVAITNNEIFIWNTSQSCLPEKIIENHEQLKSIKLSLFKENLVGYVEGHDACSRLTISNIKTNQVVYQSKSLKLLNSFSFHTVLPVVAVSNEQQVTITRVIG